MIYRVEIRKDGSIVSCDVVESALKNGGLVCYVDAENKPEACEKAKKGFERLRAAAVSRKSQAVENGLCISCLRRPPALGARGSSTLCATCRDKKNANRQLALSDPEAHTKKVKEQRAQSLVLAGRSGGEKHGKQLKEKALVRWSSACEVGESEKRVLRHCLREYDRDPVGFRAWLLAKLGQTESASAAE